MHTHIMFLLYRRLKDATPEFLSERCQCHIATLQIINVILLIFFIFIFRGYSLAACIALLIRRTAYLLRLFFTACILLHAGYRLMRLAVHFRSERWDEKLASSSSSSSSSSKPCFMPAFFQTVCLFLCRNSVIAVHLHFERENIAKIWMQFG